MTIDEAITRIVRIREYLMQAAKGLPCISPDGFHAINMAISALEHQNWIPCSEKLPEERDWYLAVFKEKDTDFILLPRVSDYMMHETEYSTSDGWKPMDSDGTPIEYIKSLICIAWKPLPDPYEENNNDNR